MKCIFCESCSFRGLHNILNSKEHRSLFVENSARPEDARKNKMSPFWFPGKGYNQRMKFAWPPWNFLRWWGDTAIPGLWNNVVHHNEQICSIELNPCVPVFEPAVVNFLFAVWNNLIVCWPFPCSTGGRSHASLGWIAQNDVGLGKRCVGSQASLWCSCCPDTAVGWKKWVCNNLLCCLTWLETLTIFCVFCVKP